MKILAIDTATEACSVALQHDNAVYSRFEICPQQHSQRVLPMIDEVLSEAGLTLSDLDLLAFGRGPGSFTGVRIATGVIQGLALGTQLPVAGISTLAAMAQQVIDETDACTVLCAIDARMNEVYMASYQVTDGLACLAVPESVCAPDAAISALLPHGDFALAGTGWQAYEALSQVASQSDSKVSVLYPDAKFMLPLARQAFNNGEMVAAEEVSPVYLRDTVTWKKLPGRE